MMKAPHTTKIVHVQVFYLECYSDIAIMKEENARSECCGSTLYQYEDGWGICGDCKEWAQNDAEND